MDLNSSKQFILNILKQKGPIEAKELLQFCRETSGCPKILYSVSDLKFFEEIEKEEAVFLCKHDKVCSRLHEERYKNILLSAITNNEGISIGRAIELLNSCDKTTAKYIQACGFESGVTEFIQRNNDVFLMKNGQVFSINNAKFSTKDTEAVKYFLEILSKKGSLTVTALSGHWNQAPNSVKTLIKSTNQKVFINFLEKNSFYFEIKDDKVFKRTSPVHELFIEVDAEDYVVKSIAFFMHKIAAKTVQTFPQLVSCLNQDGTAEIIGTVGSKKQSDVEEFVRSYPNLFHIKGNNVKIHFERNMFEKITVIGLSEKYKDYLTCNVPSTVNGNLALDLPTQRIVSQALNSKLL